MSMNLESLDGTALLQKLQNYCIEKGVSDVHISPQKNTISIDVRTHGVVQHFATIKQDAYIDLVRRVKFASKLKLNITNVPQDGQYSFSIDDRTVNVRVAIIPSRFGEAFTLRLLDPARGLVELETLGFESDLAKKLSNISQTPNGLFLVTGPTGSGKTTTLYALLRSLVGTARKIMTLEDPIEYELEGIVQSQIDEAHNYTFASGLRSILRCDPDIILVGEIRDAETAKTAVDAALTGHFVLSTLHTNSAIEAITRLLSMGVTPYTFAPALRGVLAQRLVRILKEEHRGTTITDPSDPALYGSRKSVAELLPITNDLQDAILNTQSLAIMRSIAEKNGYTPMRVQGQALVDSGITTQAEIDRVIA